VPGAGGAPAFTHFQSLFIFPENYWKPTGSRGVSSRGECRRCGDGAYGRGVVHMVDNVICAFPSEVVNIFYCQGMFN
jgi:hypothetical protein